MAIKYRAGAVMVLVLTLSPSVLLFYVFSWPLSHLFSGALFMPHPVLVGGALDQDCLTKGIFLSFLLLVTTIPYILAVSHISRCEDKIVQRTLAVSSSILMITPFSLLTITAYELSRYVIAFGLTFSRIAGILIVLLGYICLGGLLCWLWGGVKILKNASTHQKNAA